MGFRSAMGSGDLGCVDRPPNVSASLHVFASARPCSRRVFPFELRASHVGQRTVHSPSCRLQGPCTVRVQSERFRPYLRSNLVGKVGVEPT
jgi:hypothetical protein